MIKKVDFSFKFKGNRNYVHGTDLYLESIKFLGKAGYNNISKIDMTFHKIIKGQLSGYFCTDEESISILKSSFIFSFYIEDKKYFIGLNENGVNIEDRYIYSEDEIIKLSNFDLENKSIKLDSFIKYNTIEKIVALNKGLLKKLYPDIEGKWYFSRLQMEKTFDKKNNNDIVIELKRNMNFKLTKSIIYINSIKIGNIYFTLIN